ncbi:hypothetical protein O3682_11100, partial [Neisseria sp. 27098_8_112]|uniref:hypothetical protein n=1 Tax=Neisseria sp. 27098_8_112 TaxID=3003682 RepID=UPI00352F89F3
SDKPETVPNVEAGKDSTTIPQDKVKDGSEVSAKAKDPAGNESAATTVTAGNDKPSAPTVTASTEDGSVTVAVPDDAKQGDVLNVAVQGNDDPAQKTVTLTKQTDGSWTSNNPDVVPNIEVGKNSTTIPQDKVKDGSDVAAIVVRNNMPSDNATAQAGADKVVTSPTLTSNDDGSVVVNVPADAAANDTVEVTVTPESITGNATPVTVVLTKQADGSWTSSNESVVPNVKAGESNTTIDNNSVEDLSKVSAVTKTPTGLESEKTEVQALLDPPALEAATDSGDVIIELPANADIGDAVAVYFTQPSGTKYVSMVQKQADGTWAGVEEGVFNISNNKATISGSNIQDNTEVSVQHVYKTATDEIGAEYNDDGSAKAITDLTKASKLVSIISGEDKVVKLELSLAQDTGASNNDNYTRNGQVNVSGIPSGSEWEYSTDGGQTWNSGSGNSFTLPNNTKVGGIAYSLQARVKGNAASTSDTLNMTLDQKAGEFHAIIDESMNLIGTAEKNSTLTINNHSGSSDENGEFEFATGIVPNATVKKVPYTVVETDLAGNTISKDVAYTYYRRYGANTNDSYGSENDVILIGTKGGTGDLGALIKSSLNTGDGDDSVYAIGVQYHSNTLDTGNGNDFASFKNIAGTINMGAGNDILEARNTDNPFFYLAGGHPTINMGSGDDIVRTPSMINTRASIDGGDGFDTLEFVNRDGKPITTTISMISHFEKIDITGTLNNSVTISASDVEKNHSATATVDASGKSHNNVLIVDGDAGDKVTLSGISKAANSQVTYEGNTYNVYNTGSNELWVDSDITVA